MSQLLRVQNFTVSSDGIAAGENQSFESPFGLDHGDLLAWAGATASWPNRTEPGGSRGLDDYFARDFAHNIGGDPATVLEQAKKAADGKDVHLDVVPSPSGVTHHLFWRK